MGGEEEVGGARGRRKWEELEEGEQGVHLP